MNTKTEIFALIGNAVEHSLSPVMHNAVFALMGIDARYIALRTDSAGEAVNRIVTSGIRGGSITIPHKVSMMDYLDDISESARHIGAVNTFVHRDGILKGDNTDWIGIVRSLKESMTIKSKTIAILGAGGAARAAVYGIMQEGGIPIILNRTEQKGMELAKELVCAYHPLKHIHDIRADVLINTTPVGMSPAIDAAPVADGVLKNFTWVMDIIYNPLKTALLRKAETAGCCVINGLSMFVHQGAEQIWLWTGRTPPGDFMKTVVEKALET